MSVIIYNNKNIENCDKFYKELNKIYKEIIPIGHSSGCTSLIENINNNKFISKIILLDPVDSRIYRFKNFNFNNIKNILVFKAEKAYNGRPISFIPNFLQINLDNINKSKIIYKKYSDYGHCDILNPLYSDLIYNYGNMVCDGTKERTLSNLYKYIDNVTDNIYLFVKNIKENNEIEDNYSEF
jgi:hypothetical protein